MKELADYRIVREMREGNHGVAFIATAPARLNHHAEHVVLKVLRQNAADEAFERVANELRLLNAVDSPHVIELLDAGSHRGQLFLVMPHLPDGSLEDATGNRSQSEILRLVSDAARGLHALHELGVAHRDVKPANVLINGERGVVTDLGLAQLVSGTTTVVGGPRGSLRYTAPALLLGTGASRATDIWSLALTCHDTITGTHAVVGIDDQTNLVDAVQLVCHSSPRLSEDLPVGLVAVLERAFGQNDRVMHATAAEFAAEIDQVIEEEG